MSLIKKVTGIFAIAIFLGACSSGFDKWTHFVPDETPFIVVPSNNATVTSVLNSKYVPLLDDVSAASIALLSEIDSVAAHQIQLKSILLYPGVDQSLQPVWIARATSDFIDKMKSKYDQLYGQQYYHFSGEQILKIRTDDQIMFATHINNFLLISESSLGIENAIRVYHGQRPGARLEETSITPGSFVMNTPALDTWITQQAKVGYYKNIQNAFSGLLPAALNVTEKDSTVGGGYKLSGVIPISGDTKSTFVKAFATRNAPLKLAQYISFDVEAFALFRLPPAESLPETLPDTTAVDSFFIQQEDLYAQMAQTLGNAFAIEFFAESGFRSINEHAIIRELKKPKQLNQLFQQLSQQGLLKKVENAFFVRSAALCHLIGSSLCNFSNFYMQIVDEALVIAPRRGLVARVTSDYKHRKSIVYESFYKKIKKDLPKKVSGLAIGGKKLITYLKPYLKNTSYVGGLTSRFDHIAISAVNKDGQIKFKLSTYNVKSEAKPYIENWFTGLEAPLSGPPIFADIRGSANKEIIFATKAGKVYVVGAGGSIIQTFETKGEVPVGSPIAYDWYNTGEKFVMIAAGNKVFAWGANGNFLPNFPFVLDENITAPLVVNDLNNNGMADVIVATANRKVHAINARGNQLVGWPVEVNTVLDDEPLVTQFNGQTVLAAFASNAVHVWGVDGQPVAGFPHFIDAPFVGAPRGLDGGIIGAAADGKLYAFGQNNLFSNGLNSTQSTSYSEVLRVAGAALSGTPAISKESNIAVMSTDGTAYLLDANGNLLWTKSMGQNPAPDSSPMILDVNHDQEMDIVTLAEMGRLYAWNIDSGNRIKQLPTDAMQNIAIGDVDGDGLTEIVGETKNGVVSWTIN